MKSNFLFSIIIASFVFFVGCSNRETEKVAIPLEDTSVQSSKTSDSIIRSNKLYLSDCKKLLSEAKKMDSILLKEMEVKNDVANKAIKAFTDFAYYCASDSLCPIYLIKTAQVAQSINNIPQAKVVLDKCIVDYKNSIHRPAALFLLAQLYDEATYLNNEMEAKQLYQKIIDEYPKSDWAKSSKGALNFIGKSDSQIIDQLKKK
ncbi:MAG: tetratricopeptide repeat protein [Bacteroidota bacterium]|nr:tetratricopeptide repeat protein [Bacteroidota bacterium]MDP3144333.1 tetratricopeptide repeat protein [Bacteroidota bacterium]